jgi:hypothetical protein
MACVARLRLVSLKRWSWIPLITGRSYTLASFVIVIKMGYFFFAS